MSIPTQPTIGQSYSARAPIRSNRRPSDPATPLASIATDSAHGIGSPILRRASAASAAEISLEQQLLQTPGHYPAKLTPPTPPSVRKTRATERGERRLSLVGPTSVFEVTQALAQHDVGRSLRPRPSRSPSGPAVTVQTTTLVATAGPAYPPELLELLDGEHHTDELCTRFGVGWPTLEHWLAAAGGGKGDGDFGKVVVIYR
jgi:hypothetical protein